MRGLIGTALTIALALGGAESVRAQAALSLIVESDARLRGRSIGAGRPVAGLSGALDLPGGLYAGGSGLAVFTIDEAFRPLALTLNAGYARRVAPRASLDAGVVHRIYTRDYSGGVRVEFTEFHAGFTQDDTTARISFAPNYFEQAATLYAEVETLIHRDERWRLGAHGGVLIPLEKTPGRLAVQPRYDVSLSLIRSLDRLEGRITASLVGPREDRFRDRDRGNAALSAALSFSF